jgi:NAD(P)-dependent dehydrogenase (short-subunit alcohol dehydrogenase family)
MARNVLITGGNSGIGYEMALALAGQGDRVVIAARDQLKSQAAVDAIKVKHPAAQVEAMSLDLAEFSDIDRFARELLVKMPVIDVLILNAGLYTVKLHRLKNGFEAMMGIMHFGHYRLTQGLLEAVKAAKQGRIIVTSSVMHQYGRINEASFSDPSQHKFGLFAYGQAKLANLLFARELARRLKGTKVTVNAFHPGAVATGIYREAPNLLAKISMAFMLTPKQGADTAIWLANDPALGSVSGQYFVKRKLRKGSSASCDAALANRLWALSEQVMQGPVTG